MDSQRWIRSETRSNVEPRKQMSMREGAMSDEATPWCVFEYEGFDIHVLPQLKSQPAPAHAAPQGSDRYVYIGFICRHGAHADAPGETLPFHASGDDEFKSADDAVQ